MLIAVAGTGTTRRASGSASKRAAPKPETARRAAPKRATPKRTAPADPPAVGGFAGVLRDSVNSVVGSVGLNVPLRAVERLTGAVERAATLLERVERATRHLDRLDAGFVDRLNESLDVLADIRHDTTAMRERVDDVEADVRALQTLLTERLDRVPLMRPSRRERKTAQAVAENSE